ncbi:DUF7742 family protein [Roseinatronobacter sp.]
MREITRGDIHAAACVLLMCPCGDCPCSDCPCRDWPQVMAEMLAEAHMADCYRKRLGRVHARFGNGTLMAAALARAPAACATCARPSAPRYLAALACVSSAIADWRAARRG